MVRRGHRGGPRRARAASSALQLSAWALNRRGQVRADEGQQDLALADFRAALEFDPNNWRALHNRGVTYAQNGQFAEAFDDLCRVIQLNPKFAKAYSNRATLYVQAGDFEKALADYDAALAIDAEAAAGARRPRPRVPHAGPARRGAGEPRRGRRRLAPKDAEIVCSRADLLADLGRYEDALEDYAQAIDLNPKFEHAYRNGAWLLATCPDESIRDVEGALVGAQAALECGYGERHAALDTLAAALANAGRFEEAVGTIQQAIEIAPEEAPRRLRGAAAALRGGPAVPHAPGGRGTSRRRRRRTVADGRGDVETRRCISRSERAAAPGSGTTRLARIYSAYGSSLQPSLHQPPVAGLDDPQAHQQVGHRVGDDAVPDVACVRSISHVTMLNHAAAASRSGCVSIGNADAPRSAPGG